MAEDPHIEVTACVLFGTPPPKSIKGLKVHQRRTLTKNVELIKSITEHAFFESPHSAIITLEDDRTLILHSKVEQMLIQIFGELLFSPASDCWKELASLGDALHAAIGNFCMGSIVVAILSSIVVAIPSEIIVLYAIQRRKYMDVLVHWKTHTMGDAAWED